MPPLDDAGTSPPIVKPDLSGPASGIFGTIEKELPGAVAESKTNQAELRGAARDTVARLDADTKKREGLAAPPVPPPPKSPEPEVTSPREAWGSLAMVMAMLGSAFTRRPLVNALNAGAAVNNAYHKRDADAYKQAFERWKVESDYAQRAYEYQRDAYRDALALIETDQNTALARLRVIAASLKDDQMHTLAAASNIAGAISLQRERDVQLPGLKAQSDALVRHGQIVGEWMDADKAFQENPTPENKARLDSAVRRMIAERQSSLKTPEHFDQGQEYEIRDASGKVVRTFLGRASSTDPTKIVDATSGEPPRLADGETVHKQERSTDQQRGREDELFNKLKDEWQQKQRAEGKDDTVTATAEARLRSQAHGAISGRGQQQMETTLDDASLNRLADQYLAGDTRVTQGLGYGNAGAANRAALQNRISERARQLAEDAGIPEGQLGHFLAIKQAEYAGTIAGERTLGIRTTQLGLAAQEAQLLMPAVLKASENLPRSELTDLNRIWEAGLTRTGDPRVIRLGIAINSLVNTYARAVNPTGVATVSDKEHFRDLMAPFWTKGQIKEALEQLNVELDAALGAPARVRQEFREGMGNQVAPAARLGFPRAGGSTTPAGIPAGPPKIDSQGAYDALPSGAHFIGPDGKERVKP